MYKVTVTKISQMDVYVSSEEEDMDFVEAVAIDRSNRYPEELEEVDVLVDWVEVKPGDVLDPGIGTGVRPLDNNLDTGGYGKQEI